MNVMLLGPPGSGKGTLAKNLSLEVPLIHLSTGDIFRGAIQRQSPMGRTVECYLREGKLVPDELTCEVVFERLREEDARRGVIFDGFPRNVAQAEALEAYGGVDCAVLLELDRESNIGRLVGRLVCKECGSIYHLKFLPPKVRNTCDVCNSELKRRPDDQLEVIGKRLEEYRDQTYPLIEYYGTRGKVERLDALLPAPELVKLALEKIGTF